MMSSLPCASCSMSTLLDSTLSSTRSFGFSRATIMMADGMRLSAGPVMAPRLTCPDSPVLSASTSWPASRSEDSAMRAWRIMVSPYQLGRMPRGWRSNSDTPNMSSRSLSNLEAAGCDMFSTSAARWMLPSSLMAVSNMSWRVLRRARMNQGDGLDMFVLPRNTCYGCLYEYSSQPGRDLLDIGVMEQSWADI